MTGATRAVSARVAFIVLAHPDSAQAQWLDARLAEAGPALRVVVFHQPAWSCALHGSTPAVDSTWVPILEAHHVALVINGHDHYYERFRSTSDVTYVVTGGGGASLYARQSSCSGVPPSQATAQRHNFLAIEIKGRRLTLRAVSESGTVFDEALITR